MKLNSSSALLYAGAVLGASIYERYKMSKGKPASDVEGPGGEAV